MKEYIYRQISNLWNEENHIINIRMMNYGRICQLESLVSELWINDITSLDSTGEWNQLKDDITLLQSIFLKRY